MGLGVAAVTYDDPSVLRSFAADHHIEYPLLADPASTTIRAFGVLDPDNSEFNRAGDGSAKRDMAYPGYFAVDRDGIVTAKFFEGIYSDRYTPNNVLEKLFPTLVGAGGGRIRAPHLSIRLGQSDMVVAPGNRVTLFADIEIPSGVHVYAPGASHYRALELVLRPPELFEMRDALLSPARLMEFPALGEKLPVYEGRVRIGRDLIVPGRSRRFFARLREAPGHSVAFEIPGTLRYQACNARTCHPPEEVPLTFTLSVELRDL